MRLCAVVCSLCVQSTEVVKLSLLNKKNGFLDVSAAKTSISLCRVENRCLERTRVDTNTYMVGFSLQSVVCCTSAFSFYLCRGGDFPHSARERRLDLHHVELDVVAHKPVGDAGGVQVREGRI